jgi:hypothetical protein
MGEWNSQNWKERNGKMKERMNKRNRMRKKDVGKWKKRWKIETERGVKEREMGNERQEGWIKEAEWEEMGK